MTNRNIIRDIKNVISIQIDSLRLQEKAVNGSFVSAIRLIHRCKGKVIITGIGKSGLIAQKMASTFSSTGTPAIYLHPTEALHGYLGVVQPKDVIIAIGKSGESEEVLAILPSLRKIGTKIISITANNRSSLARQSDVVLLTPVLKEACPLDLAPTTSSTLALVVGDAIAISLMNLRGFGREQFAFYHPGGLLGKKLLLQVRDVMRRGKHNPVVKETANMKTLLKEISNKWTGAASIVDHRGKFLGLVTDFDIRKAALSERSLMDVKIQDVMNSNPTVIFEDEMAIKAVEIMEMRKKPFTVLPVLDRRKRSVGMIHLHDLVLKGLAKSPLE